MRVCVRVCLCACAREATDADYSQCFEESARVRDLAAATTLEAHLVKTLSKKGAAEQQEGVRKYLGLYASVPSTMVQPALWQAAQGVLAGAQAGK